MGFVLKTIASNRDRRGRLPNKKTQPLHSTTKKTPTVESTYDNADPTLREHEKQLNRLSRRTKTK